MSNVTHTLYTYLVNIQRVPWTSLFTVPIRHLVTCMVRHEAIVGIRRDWNGLYLLNIFLILLWSMVSLYLLHAQYIYSGRFYTILNIMKQQKNKSFFRTLFKCNWKNTWSIKSLYTWYGASELDLWRVLCYAWTIFRNFIDIVFNYWTTNVVHQLWQGKYL